MERGFRSLLLGREEDNRFVEALAAEELAAGDGKADGGRLPTLEDPVEAEDLRAPILGGAITGEVDEPFAVDEQPAGLLSHEDIDEREVRGAGAGHGALDRGRA